MSFIIKKILSLSNRNIKLKKFENNEETPSEWVDAESEDGSEDVEYLINKEIENITKIKLEEKLKKEKVQSAIADEIILYTWSNKTTIKNSLSYGLALAYTEHKFVYDYTFRTLSEYSTNRMNYNIAWYAKLDKNSRNEYIMKILCSIKQKIIEILKLKNLKFTWKIDSNVHRHPNYYSNRIDIKMSFTVPKF